MGLCCDSGNYVDTTTDPSGNTTDYSYNETKGTLDSVTDAKAKTTTYSYDSNLDRLTGVSKTVDGATVSNTYSYKNSSNVETDRLTKITHNGFDYNFNYDSMGNMTSVYAGSQALVTNNYQARSSKLLDSTYGNNQKIGYDYDKLDRVAAIKYNDTQRYKYYYDSDGNLAYYENRTDLGSSSPSYYTQKYTYDLSNRPVKTEEKTSTQKNITQYRYDDEGMTDRVEENTGNRNYYTGHLYDGTGNETQTYFNRYSINAGTVEYFPLNKNTTGSLGTKPTTATVTFANDENNVPAFSATTGNTLVYDIKPVVKPQSGTMAFWFTTTGSGTRYLVSNSKTNAGNLSLYINSSNKLVVEVKKTDGTMYNIVTASSITIPTTQNTWNFAAMSWSISGSTLTCTLYVMDPSNQYNLTSFQGTMSSTDCMDFTGASTAVGSTVTGTSNLTGLVGMFAYYKNMLNITYLNSILKAGRNSVVNNTYDSLGRITQKEIKTGVYKSTGANASYTTGYSYTAGANGSSTHLLQSITNGSSTISYTYDANSNIRTITQPTGTITYSYNELNELKREDNQVQSKTYVYAYDAGGNITSKSEYNYTDPAITPSNPLNVYTYTYDTVWKDKLTNYNGSSLSYDAIGNLTSDGTRTYTWEEGRNLASITTQSSSLTFKYNDSGIRTEKTVNGNTTRYHLDGDKVTYEKTAGGDDIYYTYDSDEKLVSMNLNGTEYYYVRNGQGDIIALIDNTGTQVVSYSYDTWGKVLSVSGTLASTVGAKNPYRYRGYRYDTETSLYYLQSRYYNPEWGRFINADTELPQGELLGANTFAYCGNNPIKNIDPNGYAYVSAYTAKQYAEIKSGGSICSELKMLIAIVFTEASVYGQLAQQAVAFVALNRVGGKDWRGKTLTQILCNKVDWSGYGNNNYKSMMTYLNQRTSKTKTNQAFEKVIAAVTTVYLRMIDDMTKGAVLFYSPRSMKNGSKPSWNFRLLKEITIEGINSNNFRFYKYK